LDISPDHTQLLIESIEGTETEFPFWALPLPSGAPRRLADLVAHAGSWSPDWLTVLVDERHDGVHLSYDRVTSFLSPYENPEALKVARELDSKVERLLNNAAVE